LENLPIELPRHALSCQQEETSPEAWETPVGMSMPTIPSLQRRRETDMSIRGRFE